MNGFEQTLRALFVRSFSRAPVSLTRTTTLFERSHQAGRRKPHDMGTFRVKPAAKSSGIWWPCERRPNSKPLVVLRDRL